MDRLQQRLDRTPGPSFATLVERAADPHNFIPNTHELRADSPRLYDPRARGFSISLEALTRDLLAGTGDAGGYTIESPRIEPANALRGFSVVVDAGVRVVPVDRGLPGVPFIDTPVAAEWVDENGAPTEGAPTIGLRTSSARTIGAWVDVSRRLLQQGGAVIDSLVRRDLLEAVGKAIDKAVLGGNGVLEPQGLATMSGVIAQSGTSLDVAGLASMQRQVADAGARDAECSWIAKPAVRELLQQRLIASGSDPLWEDDAVLGRAAAVSVEAPDASLFFGPWSRVLLLTWGPTSIFVNPFANPQSGTVRLVLLVDCDLVVAYPGAFARATSIT